MEVLLEGVEGGHLLKSETGQEHPWPCDLGANRQEACWPVLLLSDFSFQGCHSQLATNFKPCPWEEATPENIGKSSGQCQDSWSVFFLHAQIPKPEEEL